MHSAFLPQPSVLQSRALRSKEPKTQLFFFDLARKFDGVASVILTFDGWISCGLVGRADALGLAAQHFANSANPAPGVLANVDTFLIAIATSVSIAQASGRACAFKAVIWQVFAFCIVPARALRASLSASLLAFHQRVANIPRRARAIRPSVNDFTLSVSSASILFQAWVNADAVFAALLAGLALFIVFTLVWGAQATRVPLVPIRTEAKLPMIRHSADGVLPASKRLLAQVEAFALLARFRIGAVRIRSTSGHTSTVGANLPLGAPQLRGTSVPALAVGAGFTAGTFRRLFALFSTVSGFVAFAVVVAFGGCLHAGDERVAQKVCWAAALSQVVLYVAIGTDAASCKAVAWI